MTKVRKRKEDKKREKPEKKRIQPKSYFRKKYHERKAKRLASRIETYLF